LTGIWLYPNSDLGAPTVLSSNFGAKFLISFQVAMITGVFFNLVALPNPKGGSIFLKSPEFLPLKV